MQLCNWVQWNKLRNRQADYSVYISHVKMVVRHVASCASCRAYYAKSVLYIFFASSYCNIAVLVPQLCKTRYYCLQAKKQLAINLLSFFTDNDECAQNTHTCSLTSGVCKNTPGSFRCSCKPGFIGDGHNCEGLSICYRHLSYKLQSYRRVSSPEKSRNSTQFFFYVCFISPIRC